MSCATCHISQFVYWVVKLVGRGSVINRAILSRSLAVTRFLVYIVTTGTTKSKLKKVGSSTKQESLMSVNVNNAVWRSLPRQPWNNKRQRITLHLISRSALAEKKQLQNTGIKHLETLLISVMRAVWTDTKYSVLKIEWVIFEETGIHSVKLLYTVQSLEMCMYQAE